MPKGQGVMGENKVKWHAMDLNALLLLYALVVAAFKCYIQITDPTLFS